MSGIDGVAAAAVVVVAYGGVYENQTTRPVAESKRKLLSITALGLDEDIFSPRISPHGAMRGFGGGA